MQITKKSIDAQIPNNQKCTSTLIILDIEREINNHFSHDTMKNRDKKALPSAHGNIPFITDYYDSNKR